jgi:hypothetical protein
MSLLSRSADTFYAFRFLRLLTTAWEDTGAFKAGLVDKDGKQIKKAETADEKSVYNYFHRLVFNVKRLLNKIPFGKTTIASYLTALYLIKEETGLHDGAIRVILEKSLGLNLEELDMIAEESKQVLEGGSYQLKRDLPLPKTGELFARKGSFIIAESDLKPVGEIFGYSQYEVFHPETNKAILVNLTDLES